MKWKNNHQKKKLRLNLVWKTILKASLSLNRIKFTTISLEYELSLS